MIRNAWLSTFFMLLLSLSLALPAKTEDDIQIDEQQVPFEILQTFRKPKTIVFSCMVGGSSHVNWVLSILEELSVRGHKTIFITRDNQSRFGKVYPIIETISLGMEPFADSREDLVRGFRDKPAFETMAKFMERMTDTFEEDYKSQLNLLQSRNVDLIFCDHLNSACIEAALTLKIPYIITSTAPHGPGTSAPYINNDIISMGEPTTEFMSFWDRVNDMFIRPFYFGLNLRHQLHRHKQTMKDLGLQFDLTPDIKWGDSIILVNSAFGYYQGRPIGPLVEMVGPILPKQYSKLTPDLLSYLDNHKKVAYIAFGQHALASKDDIKLIMTALLEAYEAKDIDGILWATRGLQGLFPYQLTTQSSTTYSIHNFFDWQNGESDIAFVAWAPQVAILNHSSTLMFISHGGAGSLYESTYAGVRMVIFPFFGDQHGHASTFQKLGIGLRLDHRGTQEEATDIIRCVARDEGNRMQANIDGFQAMVQIKAKRAVARGADIAEEVLFTHKGGKLPHRRDVRYELTFFKANNYDIYSFVAVIALTFLYVGFQIGCRLYCNFFTTLKKVKHA